MPFTDGKMLVINLTSRTYPCPNTHTWHKILLNLVAASTVCEGRIRVACLLATSGRSISPCYSYGVSYYHPMGVLIVLLLKHHIFPFFCSVTLTGAEVRDLKVSNQHLLGLLIST